MPCSEAKTKDKPESRMEEIFSQNGKLKNAVGSHIGDNEVNRQLPVGLFHVEESINSKKTIILMTKIEFLRVEVQQLICGLGMGMNFL